MLKPPPSLRAQWGMVARFINASISDLNFRLELNAWIDWFFMAALPRARVISRCCPSYHAVYDHCTAKYLTQAGVKATALRLGDHGIHGNAHMIMLEKNNLQVAGLIAAWLARTIPAR